MNATNEPRPTPIPMTDLYRLPDGRVAYKDWRKGTFHPYRDQKDAEAKLPQLHPTRHTGSKPGLIYNVGG